MGEYKNYKVGGKDNQGRVITNIYSYSNDYIVYQSDGRLRIQGNTERYDKDFAVQSLLQQTVSLIPSDPSQKNKIFINLSIGIDACMHGHSEQAQKIIGKIRDSLISKAQEKSQQTGQLFYLFGSAAVGIVFAVTALIILLQLDDKPQNIQLLFFCVTSGALGGILSVMLNLKSIDVDQYSGKIYLMSSGASRILISVLSAFVTFMAIKGGLVFEIANDPDSNYSLYTLTFLAGFSEKFVPNKLQKEVIGTAEPPASDSVVVESEDSSGAATDTDNNADKTGS